MPIVKNWILCKECNRVIWKKDAIGDYCEDCAPAEPEPKPKKEVKKD